MEYLVMNAPRKPVAGLRLPLGTLSTTARQALGTRRIQDQVLHPGLFFSAPASSPAASPNTPTWIISFGTRRPITPRPPILGSKCIRQSASPQNWGLGVIYYLRVPLRLCAFARGILFLAYPAGSAHLPSSASPTTRYLFRRAVRLWSLRGGRWERHVQQEWRRNISHWVLKPVVENLVCRHGHPVRVNIGLSDVGVPHRSRRAVYKAA